MPRKIIQIDDPNVVSLDFYKRLNNSALDYTVLYLRYGGTITQEEGMAKVGNLRMVTCDCKKAKEFGHWMREEDQKKFVYRNSESDTQLAAVSHRVVLRCVYCRKIRMEGRIDIEGKEYDA